MLPLPKWSCFMLFICVLQISIKGYHCSPVRQKRNLLQLFDMVLKDTDKNPLDFIDYGCWCGLGGSGEPVDDIDRCCQQHDLCYGEVEKEFKVDPKMESYDWKSGDMIQCRNQEETCKYKTCMCDRALSQCFNQYPANPHQGKKNRHC